MPPFFSESTLKAFEDVYWIALILYYGIVGVILFVMAMYYLYKGIISKESNHYITSFQSDLILTCKIMFLCLFPSTCLIKYWKYVNILFICGWLLGLLLPFWCMELKTLKILQINNYHYLKGGSERVILKHQNSLKKRGIMSFTSVSRTPKR